MAGAICLFLMAHMEHRLGRILGRLPLPEAILARMSGLLRLFLLGLHAVDRPRNLSRFVSLTGLIWLLDVVTGMAIAWA
ncbi:MAG: hypothetical protein M3008_07520, partial [Chloroflexota bacterium]|nr:hypothetical protein [Chloroflexota bacterium]